MNICSICHEEIKNETNDYGYCNYCNEEVFVFKINELETKVTDELVIGVSLSDVLKFINQRDNIMDCAGNADEKLLKLNQYINNEYKKLKELYKEVKKICVR
jgi:Rad3-related DNA helicase